jgi:hypothetical protein
MQAPDPFHGVFTREAGASGIRLGRAAAQPIALPDPDTGRSLRISTVELSGAICPACAKHGDGGFVSFVADLRLAFACPNCQGFVWIAGA